MKIYRKPQSEHAFQRVYKTLVMNSQIHEKLRHKGRQKRVQQKTADKNNVLEWLLRLWDEENLKPDLSFTHFYLECIERQKRGTRSEEGLTLHVMCQEATYWIKL